MPRGRYCQPTEGQVPPRARARRAVEVAVHTQASRGTSMASETRAGDACKARQGALGRAEPHLAAFHQPLLEQQVTLCRLAAGAARRSAAAACIEWCLRTTRPAAPEGRGSSSTGRMPKERPPDRSGRGRERRDALPATAKAKGKQRCKVPGRGNTSGQAARVIQAGYRPGARARMPPGAPKANPSPYEPLASAPRRGTLLGGCREQPVVQGRRVRLYGRVARPAPVPHVRWTRPDAKQARRGA